MMSMTCKALAEAARASEEKDAALAEAENGAAAALAEAARARQEKDAALAEAARAREEKDTALIEAENDAAAVLGGAVIVGGLLAGAVALGAAAMMPKVVERYTLDVDKSGAEEEKIIEFERKIPFKGFKASHLFPNEPNFRYGDGNGLALASKEDLLLPDGWKWVNEWHVLKGSSANQSGTDSDGWMYAFNWGIEYAGSSSMTHCVRQRIWSRIRTTASTLRNGHEVCMTNYESDGNPDKGKQTATATLPSGTGSGNDLKDLFEKNGIADILQRATEELGIKSASDLKFIEKDDLDTLSWLTPVTKRKLLLLMAESHV
jgi:hypothetical protein